MAIRITRAADPVTVDRLTVCIYAQPGIGKTTLGFTSDRPLLLDFDRGIHRAAVRGDAVLVSRWSDVRDMTAADLDGYATVVVDAAGRALEALSADIIRRDAKLGYGNTLNLKGYGSLKAEFANWLGFLRSTGKDVVLIAHADEQRKGDETVERIDAAGSSKAEIYKQADLMGRLIWQDGHRVLTFRQTESAFAKAPPGIDAYTIPTPPGDLLARVIRDSKAAMNAIGEEGRRRWLAQEAQRAEWAEASVEVLTDAARSGMDPALKRILWDVAKARGLSWDREALEWRGPAVAVEAVPHRPMIQPPTEVTP